MTRATTSLLLCAVAFAALFAATDANLFDCRREGQDCQGGAGNTCDYQTGMCTCAGGRVGHACERTPGQIITNGVCTGITCLNDAYGCYNDAGAPKCLCDSEWTGPTCAMRRVRIDSCAHDKIEMTVEPYESVPATFMGRIAFMKGKRGFYQHIETSGEEDAGCDPTDLVQVVIKRQDGTTIVRDKQTCVHREDGTEMGKIVVEFGVSVQYLREVWGDLDQSFEMQCIYAKAGEVTNMIVATLPTASPEVATKETDVIPVAFTIVDSGNVQQGINIKGQQRFLRFVFQGAGVFKNFIVDECTAHGTDDKAVQPLLGIVANKCFTRAAAPYFKTATKDFTVGAATGETKMEFTVFKFKNIEEVYFTCRIHLCKGFADAVCNPTCPTLPQAFGRRRRSLAEDNNDGLDMIITRSIKVLDRQP